MFSGATAFNQDLCQWGAITTIPITNPGAVDGMFLNTLCPQQGFNPILTTDPKGPYCAACGPTQAPTTSPTTAGPTTAPTPACPATCPPGAYDPSPITTKAELEAALQNPDLSAINCWDVSQVTDMYYLFRDHSTFNEDISCWDVSAVTDMSYMFFIAAAFNQDIGGWNVAAVTNMENMFGGASAFDQDISSWNVTAVTNMRFMFNNAAAFNQDIGGWNVAAVTNMRGLFWGGAFNQDISGWNVAAVTDMYGMFRNAPAFNQDIGGWNIAAVTDMTYMFYGADAFNQDLCQWGVITTITNPTFVYKMFGFTLCPQQGDPNLDDDPKGPYCTTCGTPAPTPAPTTGPPTTAPTPAPTTASTPGPTTAGPTPAPTPAPTTAPTPGPTTAGPTPAPTTAPTPGPTMAPTPALDPPVAPPSTDVENTDPQDEEPLFLCFSGRTTVNVQGQGTTRMDALKIGDSVLTAGGTYSKVYSFGHSAPSADTLYLQIQADSMSKPLEITTDHMIYKYNEDKKRKTFVPAGDVQVGDSLIMEQGLPTLVKTVRKVQRHGAYAPFTVTGDIMVNGVIASNYIALPAAFQKSASFDLQHWIQHAAYAPYRLFCGVFGCEDETYDDVTGLSKAVKMWLPVLYLVEHSTAVGSMTHLLLAALGYYVWKKAADKKVRVKNDDNNVNKKPSEQVETY